MLLIGKGQGNSRLSTARLFEGQGLFMEKANYKEGNSEHG